jgi:hypothetical protein
MSKKSNLDVRPARDSLARALANKPGFDSVGITKKDGNFALSVFLTEPGFHSTALPNTHEGYPIVRKKASEFVPH